MSLRIRGGHLIDPANGIDAETDLCIGDGAIVALGRAPAGFRPQREIDARGLIVSPGFIDLCAHPREPGAEYKATIASEAAAALRGGFTTICCPPDTDPVIDTPAVVDLIKHRATQARAARVLCLGAVTQGRAGSVLSEMAALRAIGCVGVSNARQPIRDTLVLRHALEYAATLNLTVFARPEDPWLGATGRMHEGAISTRLGISATPGCAESIEVSRWLLLCEQTGARIHFGRLSTARSVRLVRAARRAGLPVSADVGIAYLHYTDVDVGDFDGMFHLQPPLAGSADRSELVRALGSGAIDAICSDHQPHDADAKAAPFSATEPGMSLLDTFVPMLLELTHRHRLPLARAIAAVTQAPARVLGSKGGQLGVGAVADLILIDPNLRWSCNVESLHSDGKNSPRLGQSLTGRTVLALVGGRVAYDVLGQRG
ncbi:MAG: dihydroorotase [Gammaproteobacteria bacterium]|nr:dihydroorotase [Gammaproteobacteria bacterium]